MPYQITAEDLDALNTLVQDGLIEIAWIEDGIPSYRLAKEFTAGADSYDAGGSASMGPQSDACSARPFSVGLYS
jgi:hypothetical protein